MKRAHHGCGKEYYEKIKHTKKDFKGNLLYGLDQTISTDFPVSNINLFSSYLGKVPIRAHVIDHDNILLESIFVTASGRKINLKVLDLHENNLNDDYIYPIQQLIHLKPVKINTKENLYKYYVTLYCYMRINEAECCDDVVKKYKGRIDEVHNDDLYNKMSHEYPELVGSHIPLKVYKKILQSVTEYNSRIDVMFAAIEYLEFVNKFTGGIIDTVNNQDLLIFITGVPKLDNAYWNGSYMVFGSGNESFYPLTSVDVIGHELTHGVVQGICDLEYKGHPGALNESYADIFGTILEFYIYEKFGDSLFGKSDWCIGEDLVINDRCLRDMADPNSCDQPAKMFDKFYMDPTSMVDHGGVHINSGIPNHCFYLISQAMDKYDAFKIFINCLFKLCRQTDFYTFSSTLSSTSNNKQVDNSLQKVGLPPSYFKQSPKNPRRPSDTPLPSPKNKRYPPDIPIPPIPKKYPPYPPPYYPPYPPPPPPFYPPYPEEDYPYPPPRRFPYPPHREDYPYPRDDYPYPGGYPYPRALQRYPPDFRYPRDYYQHAYESDYYNMYDKKNYKDDTQYDHVDDKFKIERMKKTGSTASVNSYFNNDDE